MKFKYFLLLTLALPFSLEAQVKGKVFVEMLEAGGNGAAYGYVSLSAEGRTQGLACPRVANGNIPTGKVLCETTYGSSLDREWQPGDKVTAVIKSSSSASIPKDKQPPDVFSCIWEFAGFTKACTGLGNFDPIRGVYECEFFLPLEGDISLGVMISGHDAYNRDCPKLDAPSTPLPSPSSNPSSVPTPVGNALLEALIGAVDDLADGLKIGKLTRKIAEKVIFPKTSPAPYKIDLKVYATGEGTGSIFQLARKKKKKKKKVSISGEPLIAKGSVKTSGAKNKSIRIRPTAKGKKIARGRSSLAIRIEASASYSGSPEEAISIETEISR